MDEQDIPEQLTVAQAAELLHRSTRNIISMISKKQLSAAKIAGEWTVSGIHVAQILASIHANVPPPHGARGGHPKIPPHQGESGVPW
jgi:DNA-directed RNA polymerase specialized sigma subunit